MGLKSYSYCRFKEADKIWRNSRNKVVAGCIVSFFLVLYMFPGLFNEGDIKLAQTGCLAPYLTAIDDRIDSNDVRVVHYKSEDALSPVTNGGHKHRPSSEDFDSLGFVGNGRYGFILRNGGKLLIGNETQHFLSLEADTHNLNPIHHIYVRDINSHHFTKYPFYGAVAMDFLNGIGTYMQSFAHSRHKCVTIQHDFLFHREHSNLFIEKIYIRNELAVSVEVSIEALMQSCLPSADSRVQIGDKVFCKRQ